MFDLDGGGAISFKELQDIFKSFGKFMTLDEISNLIADADLNKDGDIDFHEFCKTMERCKQPNEN